VSRSFARLITPSPPGSHPSRALTITPPQPRGPGRTNAALDWTKPTPRPAAHVDRSRPENPRFAMRESFGHDHGVPCGRRDRHELSIDNSCLPASLVAGRPLLCAATLQAVLQGMVKSPRKRNCGGPVPSRYSAKIAPSGPGSTRFGRKKRRGR
jgi:hypothetical protein